MHSGVGRTMLQFQGHIREEALNDVGRFSYFRLNTNLHPSKFLWMSFNVQRYNMAFPEQFHTQHLITGPCIAQLHKHALLMLEIQEPTIDKSQDPVSH